MKQWLKGKIRQLAEYLFLKSIPYRDEVVTSLILNTSSLELKKGEWIELAPLPGCCGPFRLSGNGLPVFEYLMFEKSIMEFVLVRVEIAKPDIIRYITTIHAKKESSDTPERHGEVIETTERHKQPFEKLSLHLFRYFAHYFRHHKMVEATTEDLNAD